jgi:hypothetical protein
MGVPVTVRMRKSKMEIENLGSDLKEEFVTG